MADIIQNLMDEVYDFWQMQENRDMSQRELLDEFSSTHRCAVLLGNLNYQVENGGLDQWHYNGYSEFAFDIIDACDKAIDLGFEFFRDLKAILSDFCAAVAEDRQNKEELDTLLERADVLWSFEDEFKEVLDDSFSDNLENLTEEYYNDISPSMLSEGEKFITHLVNTNNIKLRATS